MKKEKYVINGKKIYIKRTFTVNETSLFQRIKIYLDRLFEEERNKTIKKGE